jgi:hypothetical protein
MKLKISQLRSIIKEEANTVLSESENVQRDMIKHLMEKFVEDVRKVDPAINFGNIEGDLARAFRRPARQLTPDQRAAATKKAAATRAANKDVDARMLAKMDTDRDARKAMFDDLKKMGITQKDYSDASLSLGGGGAPIDEIDILARLLGSRTVARQLLDKHGLF